MKQLIIAPELTEQELSHLRELFAQRSGLTFEGQPPAALDAHIRDYMEESHIFSGCELLRTLRASRSEYEKLLGHLLACESRFFRHSGAFRALVENVLPEVRQRKFCTDPRNLRIWSAGCASGEEAYSIAIATTEALELSDDWTVNILATDISSRALQHAERGVYPQAALDALVPRQVEMYFARIGDQLLVKPALRKMVTFTCANLAECAPAGRFDCIFCLDVLPCLHPDRRNQVVEHFGASLEPGGYLVLAADRTAAIPAALELVTEQDALIYRKPAAAAP